MRRPRQSRREPTIALINIVFLMLVFFLVAGTLAPPIDRDLTLITTADLPPEAPPDALVLHADGRMTWRGEQVASGAAYLDAAPEEAIRQVRLVPDRAVPAVAVIQLGQELRAAGAESVVIVTERSLR